MNKEWNIKIMKKNFFIAIVLLLLLSCKNSAYNKLPETDTNKFINGNTVTFPVWTNAHEMYDTFYYLFPNINSFNVKNGKHGTLEINKIEYRYTVEGEKNYHKIYFYNDSKEIKKYEGVWWEYESGRITGYADATDIVISFTLE